MKAQKLITLDLEIMEKLSKEANASGLINNLLIAHYKVKRLRTKEEVMRDIKALSIKEKAEKELEKLNEHK